MKPELIIKSDKTELISLAAKTFYDIALSPKDKIHISLSGGNTPKLLFAKIVEAFGDKIDWNKIVFWWGDERCVPPHDDDSNFKMTKEFLLDHIDMPSENINRIKGEDNPDEEAKRYGDLINELVPLQNDIPNYDLIYLGLGEDGHTASIFPNQISNFNAEQNCVGAVHPESGQRRVSITGRIINNASNVFLLITGQSKAEVVREIINNEPASSVYPASLVNPVGGNYKWFLDGSAAELL